MMPPAIPNLPILETVGRYGWQTAFLNPLTVNSVMKRLPPSDKSSQRRQADISEATLTRGEVNAVRSAFKAGITPARIARQFGISQSNVRKALATDEPKQ